MRARISVIGTADCTQSFPKDSKDGLPSPRLAT